MRIYITIVLSITIVTIVIIIATLLLYYYCYFYYSYCYLFVLFFSEVQYIHIIYIYKHIYIYIYMVQPKVRMQPLPRKKKTLKVRMPHQNCLKKSTKILPVSMLVNVDKHVTYQTCNRKNRGCTASPRGWGPQPMRTAFAARGDQEPLVALLDQQLGYSPYNCYTTNV